MNEIFLGAVFIIGIVVIVSIIAALPTMLLWNWLIPSIFGLKTISFFEALGICILCQILFGSHGSTSSK